MAIVIKDVGTLQTKYTNRATNATSDYKAGVMAPRTSQSQAAIASADRWQSAVSSSTAKARFTGGLSAAGDAGWQAGASGKGAAHYADGVRGGASKWANHVGPYLQAIASLSLPPKGIRGSDANIARVSAVATALHTLKLSKAGAK